MNRSLLLSLLALSLLFALAACDVGAGDDDAPDDEDDIEPARDFSGPDHTGYLDEAELRLFAAIMDVGFPYLSRCDDKVIPSGPNAGEYWGDPEVIEY